MPSFRLDQTIWTLRRRPDNALDRWDGRTYRRILVLVGLLVEAVTSAMKRLLGLPSLAGEITVG